MILTSTVEPDGSRRFARASSLLASICLHAAVIGSIFMLPPFRYDRGRVRVGPVVRWEITPIQHKVIWLRRDDRLPEISPTVQPSNAGPTAKAPDKMLVLTNPPKATHWDQFVYVPVPKVTEQKAIPSPNVIVTTPVSQQPPKPEPRKFVPPPDHPKEVKPREVELQEPAIARQSGAGLDMKAPAGLAKLDAPKPALRKFVPPPDPERKVRTSLVEVPEGPPIQASNLNSVELALPAGQIDAPRPPGKKFTPPAALTGGNKLGGGPGGAGAGQEILVPEITPSPSQSGVPGEVSAVIISVFPSANASIIPPEGNRLSKIQIGSRPPGGQGGATAAASGEGLVVPGVTVRGGSDNSGGGVVAANTRPPVPLAASAITPTPLPSIKPRLDTPSISIPQRPNSRRVPQQVEGVFQNRIVYCTVMPGPSGVPDWVVWFGDKESLPPGSRSVVRPPIASKTTLASVNAGGSVGSKLWIVAQLGRNGKLTGVQITAGLGEQEARKLANEMESWVFTPAIRNGEAMDVDLVLEAKLPGNRP